MDIEHLSPEVLQRYFDTELTAQEQQRLPELQAHLAACADCTAQLAQLARLHDFVAMAVKDSSQHVDFGSMFANIERALVNDSDSDSGKSAQAPSILIKPSSAVGAVSAAKPLHPKLRRLSNAVPALGAVALAAAALLMVYRGDPPQNGSDESYEVTADGHSEIVEVDFGSNAGTVFDISLSDGSSSPVVWIDDDDQDDNQDDHGNANANANANQE